MIRAPRPKPQPVLSRPFPTWGLVRVALLALAALGPAAAWAQSPLASSYATRDGRAPTTILGCVSTDGSFMAQPCGVTGYPLHVTIDGGSTGGTPTTAPGTASPQLVGVQGGGSGALPVSVTDAAIAQVVVQTQLAAAALGTPNDAAASSTGTVVAQLRRIATLLAGAPNGAINADAGSQVHVMNFPVTQPVSAASLPLPAGAATAALQPALNGDGGSQVHVMNLPATQAVSGSVSVSNLPATQAVSGSVSVSNLPATQAVSAASLPLPAGAATAANQAAVNADGGSQVHVMNLPATQAVSAASLPLPAGAATAANQAAVNADGGSQVHLMNALPAGANTIGTVVAANRSGAWTDASFTATSTASSPAALAAVASRTGLHVWNVGTATVCLNYTSAASASGSGCAAGSVPIAAGSAYLEDQPGNVSPEAISLVCAGSSCPLTIKIR